MITYPAHLATKAQEELQCPCYKNGNVPSLPLTGASSPSTSSGVTLSAKHDPPPRSAATLSWWPSR
eukprot:1478892-Pleurochrysis_carterae.AAC.1